MCVHIYVCLCFCVYVCVCETPQPLLSNPVGPSHCFPLGPSTPKHMIAPPTLVSTPCVQGISPFTHLSPCSLLAGSSELARG